MNITSRRKQGLALLVGIAILCPTRLVGGVNFRLSDLAMALLVWAGSSYAVAPDREYRIPVTYAAIALLTLEWIGAEFNYHAYLPTTPGAAMILARWIVALPAALYLAVLSSDAIFRRYFLLGAILGCLITTALLVLDFVTYQRTGAPAFPVDSQDLFFVNGEFRAGGIIGQANGAAITSLFVIPLLIAAAEEFGKSTWAVIAAVLLTGIVFYVTQTRSALIGAVSLLLIWGLVRRPSLVLTAVAGLSVVVTLGYLLDPGSPLLRADGHGLISMLVTRFTNEQALQSNAASRIDTTINALELALQHPFGMGSAYEAPLDEATGFAATHNGFLQLALLGGIPLALSVTIPLVIGVASLRNPPRATSSWLALYVLIVSFFESTYYLPSFSIIVLWIVAQVTAPSWTTQLAAEH